MIDLRISGCLHVCTVLLSMYLSDHFKFTDPGITVACSSFLLNPRGSALCTTVSFLQGSLQQAEASKQARCHMLATAHDDVHDV